MLEARQQTSSCKKPETENQISICSFLDASADDLFVNQTAAATIIWLEHRNQRCCQNNKDRNLNNQNFNVRFSQFSMLKSYNRFCCTDRGPAHWEQFVFSLNTWKHMDRRSQGLKHSMINSQPAWTPKLQPVAVSPMLIFVIHQLLSFICFGITNAFAFHAKKATENEKQRERERERTLA